ncbi:MAG TPA: rhomboid family intramembrane serine protease [Polyangiaceae bacterium]|nr:rhomboid family intramembrane serine protease [Polyangiaceae bacterium]
MLPLRDRLPTRTFPFVNYLLVVANVVSFLWQEALAEAGYTALGADFGFVPHTFITHPVSAAPTIFTSMFMHGGWLHLGGNMLALYIFGDNIEDAIGHFRYLVFYLLGGIAAAFLQMATDPTSTIPMVGASGAIAAVMAAYLSLYPRSPITVLNPVPFLWLFFGLFWELPAWVIALEFFVLNLWSGLTTLVVPHGHGMSAMGNVAVFAHVGGFLAGLVLVRLFMAGRIKASSERWNGWRPPARRSVQDLDDPRYYR